jgi:hypothetical protein
MDVYLYWLVAEAEDYGFLSLLYRERADMSEVKKTTRVLEISANCDWRFASIPTLLSLYEAKQLEKLRLGGKPL